MQGANSRYINKQIKSLTLRHTQGIVPLSDKKGTENLMVFAGNNKEIAGNVFLSLFCEHTNSN